MSFQVNGNIHVWRPSRSSCVFLIMCFSTKRVTFFQHPILIYVLTLARGVYWILIVQPATSQKGGGASLVSLHNGSRGVQMHKNILSSIQYNNF